MTIKQVKNALPDQDSATGRGLKSGLFASAGTLITLVIGLFTVIHNVPGCGEAIADFVQKNLIIISGSIGVPAGLLSFGWNYLRKGVANY